MAKLARVDIGQENDVDPRYGNPAFWDSIGFNNVAPAAMPPGLRTASSSVSAGAVPPDAVNTTVRSRNLIDPPHYCAPNT